jgi:glycosyltransferase involved in cell wall biosynthesis
MSNKSESSINWSLYCVIIPVYNSRKTLPVLIERILDLYPQLDIIVVDDGSPEPVNQFLDNDKVEIIRHKQNRGKGAALKTGITHAKKIAKKYAIFLDSDLQHDPAEILKFINKRHDESSDIVLGVRDIEHTMPFHRVLSNTITSSLISLRTGVRVHDSQCGFRLLDLEKIDPNNYIYNGFQFESEFLIKNLGKRGNFAEVKIKTIYNGHGSNMENMKDTLRFIKMYFTSYFWK